MTTIQQLTERYPKLMAALETADTEAKTEFLAFVRMFLEEREELRRMSAKFVAEHRRVTDLMKDSRVKL